MWTQADICAVFSTIQGQSSYFPKVFMADRHYWDADLSSAHTVKDISSWFREPGIPETD